jgi:hypothetical protein
MRAHRARIDRLRRGLPPAPDPGKGNEETE